MSELGKPPSAHCDGVVEQVLACSSMRNGFEPGDVWLWEIECFPGIH